MEPSHEKADERATGGLSDEELRRRILAALNNPRFRNRTIAGISKEARIEQRRIVRAFARDAELAASVKILPVRTEDGRPLFTTKERFVRESSFSEKFVDFFASKRVALGD